jgi:hypothetical protein
VRHQEKEENTMRARMLECSELRISEIARVEHGHRKLVASRVLESTYTFRQWDDSHTQLIRGIVAEHKTDRQLLAIKRVALAMIHLKAPFEYLRDQRVQGAERHRFFNDLYGGRDFASAVVQEHRNYVTSYCSYLCIDRFCSPDTMNHIVDYEKSYTNYWRSRTACLTGTRQSSNREAQFELLLCIREELQKSRERVLDAAPNRADSLTLEELRRPTGDTVRMPVLGRKVRHPGQVQRISD